MKYERWREPFDRAGIWILERFPGILSGQRGRCTEEKLKLLETTRDSITLKTFYRRKISRILMFLFGGGLILGALALMFPGEVSWMEHPYIERPDYGAGSLETELTASVRKGENLKIALIIEERKYSAKELEQIFNEILENLETDILGENVSLEEVRTDLKLPSSFQDNVILAQWGIDPPGYMDETGHFLCEVPEEGLLATLRLTLTYGKEEVIREIPVQFLPREKSPEEHMADSLKTAAEAAEAKDPEAEKVDLPEVLDGEAVRWGSQTTSPLLVGILFLTLGIWYLCKKDDRELTEEEKYRNQQMIMDYPVILYKMSMLMGAGMTIRGAFSKIAFHYKDQGSEKIRYAYEEMLLACYEMDKGIGEAAAYENFGRKCRDLRYLKFGSLLSQNLKKGSKGLEDILEQEAKAGMEERKNLARRLGEEASTKLLLPMMLMLVVVIVILMVPAMLSF